MCIYTYIYTYTCIRIYDMAGDVNKRRDDDDKVLMSVKMHTYVCAYILTY
jgi:hypothetical protein